MNPNYNPRAMKAVPLRGSEWVLKTYKKHEAQVCWQTNPLPRGGTDFMTLRDGSRQTGAVLEVTCCRKS